MAMNKSTLASAIVTKLKTKNAEITGAAETELTAYWELIADAIITHIINESEITGTATGVQAGGDTANTSSSIV